MSNEIEGHMTFEEFTDQLLRSGWHSLNDSQHKKVRGLYDKMVATSLREAQQNKEASNGRALQCDD